MDTADGDMRALITFFSARLDELGETALATIDINHRVRMRNGVPPPRWVGAEDSSDIRSEDGILRVKHTWVRERDHIIRHDPADALADIAADRAILDMYEGQDGHDLPEGVRDGRDPDERQADEAVKGALEQVVRIRAARFASHPDYRAEKWKP